MAQPVEHPDQERDDWREPPTARCHMAFLLPKANPKTDERRRTEFPSSWVPVQSAVRQRVLGRNVDLVRRRAEKEGRFMLTFPCGPNVPNVDALPIMDNARHPLLRPYNAWLAGGSNRIGTVIHTAIRAPKMREPRMLDSIAIGGGTTNRDGSMVRALHIFPGIQPSPFIGPKGGPFEVHHVTVRPTNQGRIEAYFRPMKSNGAADDNRVLTPTSIDAQGDRGIHLLTMAVAEPELLAPAGTVTRTVSGSMALAAKEGLIQLHDGQPPEHFYAPLNYPASDAPHFLQVVYTLEPSRRPTADYLDMHLQAIVRRHGEIPDLDGDITGSHIVHDLGPLSGNQPLRFLHVSACFIPGLRQSPLHLDLALHRLQTWSEFATEAV